ncbi:hypothetical protein [Burkholderia contaminans]|uniref:Uncharacterized protein n=1 Tax=Burkholderia contaminans TaxID=488447 RepID=A0A2S5DM47_9BURK|nr:hypothetical protein [Burkholderia contaminans]POZ80154.1 hypothetical protein C3743_39940 [Burkholderia contaminans]
MSTTDFDQSDVFREGGHEQGKPSGMFNDIDRPDAEEAGDRPAKKKGTLLPMVAGIGLVVIVAGFGVWKIVAPHLQSSQSSDDLGPLSAPQIAQMAPAPAGPMPGPAVAQQQSPQLPTGQGNTGSMPPLSQSMPSGVLQGGQQPQGASVAPGAVAMAVPGVIASSPSAAPAAAGNPAGGSPAQATVPQTSGTADAGSVSSPSHQATTDADFRALSARVNAIEESLKTISTQLEVLKAKGGANARADKTVDKAAPPSETHVARAAERRHASTKHRESAKATTPTSGDETTQGAAGGDSSMRLKAVTEGRAWVQTKAGETVTVTTGDSVAPGVTVKSINADSGEVRLSNGNVLR